MILDANGNRVTSKSIEALEAENTQLRMENQSLFKGLGALVISAGGEVRIPSDIDSYTKGKQLNTYLDPDSGEIIFKISDSPLQKQ